MSFYQSIMDDPKKKFWFSMVKTMALALFFGMIIIYFMENSNYMDGYNDCQNVVFNYLGINISDVQANTTTVSNDELCEMLCNQDPIEIIEEVN